MTSRLWLADDVAGSDIESALRNPRGLLDSAAARFLKDHRRTAVACVRVGDTDVFVKWFKSYAWYRRVENRFARTPARRAWRNAELLRELGFRVPRPLACAEIGTDSYFVTESVPGAEPAADFWLREAGGLPRAERLRILEHAADTLRRFHDSGLYSRDTNANNFLVRTGPEGGVELFFLDLEHVRRLGRVSRRRRVKNLVQLYRLFRDRLPRAEVLRFLDRYLGLRGRATRRERRRWLRDLGRIDLRKDAEYRARARRRG